MASNETYKLLERYWEGETSLEEEGLLQDLFATDSVPEELKVYKSLFIWKNQQKAIQANPVRPVVSRKTMVHYFYPAMKVAASVLIVLLFGIGIHTHYQQEQLMEQLFSDSSPEALDARKDSVDVMAKVSLQLSSEQIQEEDSLLLTGSKTLYVEKE